MDSGTHALKRTVPVYAVLAFAFWSVANIFQTPTLIGNTVSESTVLSLFRAGSALLVALYILKVGTTFRRLLALWGIAVFFFVFSPVLGLLSPSPFSDHVYFAALGIATSVGLIAAVTSLSRLPWDTVKYVIIFQHMLAGVARYSVDMLGPTDIKAIEYLLYVLFVIATVAWIVFAGTEKDFELVPARPVANASDQVGRRQITLIWMAVGGAALAPLLVGAYEQLAWNPLGLARLQPTASIVNNLVIPAIFLIVFLFRKEISIEVSFFIVSISAFALLLIALLDSRFANVLYVPTLSLGIYIHLALWLFVFKTGKAGPVQTGVLMGVSEFTVVFSRMCGNLMAYVAHTFANEQSALATVTLWALAAFALINLSLFVVTYGLQRGIADSALAETRISEKTTLEDSALLLATRYALSPREHQVLLEYAAGRSAPFIADKYHLSVFTVKNYIGRIYTKMDIHSRQQLLDLLEAEDHSR